MRTVTRNAFWIVVLLPLLAACDSSEDLAGTFTSDTETLGQGTIWSWATRDEDGALTEMGITFTASALQGLPNVMTEVVLPVPDAVKSDAAPFDHVSIDWNPAGHEPPGVYDLPHFDLHFYMMTAAERAQITPADPQFEAKSAARPADKYVPAGYIQTPGAVPNMGAHWLDAAAGELHGATFTKTFIYGVYDGEIVFMEPMITKAYFESVPGLSGQSVTTPIAQPQAFAEAGYYPSRYTVSYDAAKQEYTVTLENLTWHNAE